MILSSAITIAGSQAIAKVCFHMIADDRRTFCDLRSAIVCEHMETSLNISITSENTRDTSVSISRNIRVLMRKWEQHKTNKWVLSSAYVYAYVAGVLTCLCLCYAYACTYAYALVRTSLLNGAAFGTGLISHEKKAKPQPSIECNICGLAQIAFKSRPSWNVPNLGIKKDFLVFSGAQNNPSASGSDTESNNQRIEDFVTANNELLDKISRENKTCILMGDFNVNLMNYHHNHHLSRWNVF